MPALDATRSLIYYCLMSIRLESTIGRRGECSHMLLRWVAAGGVATAVACGDAGPGSTNPGPPPTPQLQLVLSLSDSLVTAGATVGTTLVQQGGAAIPSTMRIIWSVANPSVAVIDTLGRVTAVGEGSTQISVSAGGGTTSRRLDVRGIRSVVLADGGSCVLRSDGRIFCWGGFGVSNAIGANAAKPFEIASPVPFTSFAVGTTHACAISEANDLYCWGTSTFGALGTGVEVAGLTAPTKVAGTGKYRMVALALMGSCALDTRGTPYCWGSTVYGLGTGTSVGNLTVPTVVPTTTSFDRIAASFYTFCGSEASGSTSCWGGSVQPLGGVAIRNAVSSAGNWFCSPTPNGDAACWTWGVNIFDTIQPASIVKTGAEVATVTPSFDGRSFCGLTVDGIGKCWGVNDQGQLGIGTSIQPNEPTYVAGDLRFRAIAMQRSFACGVTMSGRLYCWGDNHLGDFGDGTRTSSNVPVPITIP
jgi:hypothetical protein